MSLFSGTSNVVYLVRSSDRIVGVEAAKYTLQVKPLNSVVLMVNTCSTTPVVFNLAFKTSTVIPHQYEREGRKSLNQPSVGMYFFAVIRGISSR